MLPTQAIVLIEMQFFLLQKHNDFLNYAKIVFARNVNFITFVIKRKIYGICLYYKNFSIK